MVRCRWPEDPALALPGEFVDRRAVVGSAVVLDDVQDVEGKAGSLELPDFRPPA